MTDAASVKQQAQFLAWGQPLLYVTAAAIVVAAFVPTFRSNAGYIKANMFGHIGKLTSFSALNIIISIFLFWSPSINFALITFLLSFLVACTVTLPTFPRDFARPLCYIYIAWILIQTNIVPNGQLAIALKGNPGILDSLSLDNCNSHYKQEPTVIDKICKDGWITFTIFCAILTVGLNFLTTLQLASIAFDPANQIAPTSSSSDAAGGVHSHSNLAYQQPTVGNPNGEYQSYQNYQSADPVAKEQVA